MDLFLRVIAITIEVILLAAITYSVLVGVKLTVFDLGLKTKYNKIINVAFLIVGCLVVVFFIAHLTFLYPTL